MSKVTVECNLSPEQAEERLQRELIRLGWIPPWVDTTKSDNSDVVARLEKRIADLDRERDELAAYADDAFRAMRNAVNVIDLIPEGHADAVYRMESVMQNKPASSLARRDARVAAAVWHQVAIEVGPDGAFMDMDALQNHAESERDRLSREAEGETP